MSPRDFGSRHAFPGVGGTSAGSLTLPVSKSLGPMANLKLCAVMACELFGLSIGGYALITCATSWLVAGRKGLYDEA